MNLQDRHLNFNNFINQRAQEIAKFSAALDSDTRKKGHQAVPKSLRRRAMSHNRYRIPLRIRKPIEEELDNAQKMQKLPKCRKHIRKKHRLLISYKKKSDKCKWLSTHLWATKRMKMINYFKYKIAYTPNDKSFRSAYRHFRHNACLLDLSYYQCLKINLNASELDKWVKINNFFKKYLDLSFGQIYYGEVVQEERMICPIFIIRQSQQIANGFFDPCCKEELEILANTTKQQQNVPSFEIIGPHCQIYLLLGPSSIQKTQQLLQELQITMKQFQNLPGCQPAYFPPNKLFYHIQPINFPYKQPGISSPFAPLIRDGYSQSSNQSLREQFQILYQHYTNKNKSQKIAKESEDFWKFYESQLVEQESESKIAEELMIKVTTRSKYTHKRKNKMTKEEKKKILKEQSEKKKINPESFKQKSQKEEMEIEEVAKKQMTLQKEERSPIAIGMINTNNTFEGCFIFCNSNQNCLIWRTLTRLNVKVIGQRQFKHCLLQSGMRSFPEDYPQTKSFENYAIEKSVIEVSKYKRLPPQKRINYHKISSPFPFSISLSMLKFNKIVYVSVEMVGRGRCFSGSYICKLQPEDFEGIQKYFEIGDALKHIVEEKKTEQTTPKIKNQSPQQVVFSLKKIADEKKMCRKMIGYVTSGGYLYNKCREGGIGFITLDNQYREMQSYVLIRKPSSKFYFLGHLKTFFHDHFI